MQEHIVKKNDLRKSLEYWCQYRDAKDVLVVPFKFTRTVNGSTATHFLVYMK